MATPAYAETAYEAAAYNQTTITGSAYRYNGPSVQRIEHEAIARFGPFRVLDEHRVALLDITDERTPGQFAAMMQAFPELEVLEMVECPGTFDDHANLRLGRLIRAAGLATHVPADGSVRSGAVELFFSGVTRRIDNGAEFAVHAWLDDSGREATSYAATSPENLKYLAYYKEMGFDAEQAKAFYAMTNSVAHEDALWLDAQDMRRWTQAANSAPRLAYLDLSALLQ
ncbi:alpha/beta hydrolase [Altererythrobacter indicus]|uniref:Alpha/beta hydrolase n=1 Tax=Altericroceibacterium indicum TaxID=374177 RepID=A0A845ABF3_9SPHN|nr:alpha/beta hydrolase [Altericroceibacterium indicum]MXP26115.1 alpha/beta hydrolase [Altericroceibacterium indicum]